jgi:hypothetical protein
MLVLVALAEILSGSIQNVGKFKTLKRLVNLNADRKRFWLGMIESPLSDKSKSHLSLHESR